jgi:hypothetical protein
LLEDRKDESQKYEIEEKVQNEKELEKNSEIWGQNQA